MSSSMSSYMNETISLRGYANGSIAGSQYDYAYSYFKTALELRYPLIFEQSTTIWVLGFLEAGNAWRENNRYNPFDLKRSAGVGVRNYATYGWTTGHRTGHTDLINQTHSLILVAVAISTSYWVEIFNLNNWIMKKKINSDMCSTLTSFR